MDEPVDRAMEQLAATRKFLALCMSWLPHGLLRDMIRLVTQEGQDPVAAWETLEERLR